MSSTSSLTIDEQNPEKPVENTAPKPQPPATQPVQLTWNGADDPDNPQNWKVSRKWTLTFFLAFITFSATFSSSLFSADVVPTAERFNVSTEVTTLETSLFVAGLAAGPVMFGPLSEQVGRKWPLLAGILIMTIFHIPVSVAQNITTILVGRFLAGIGGSSPISVIGGMLVDFWDPVGRGIAICGFATATFAGPILGPVVGGFMIVGGLSWRWLGYLNIILGGFMFTVGLFVIPETHAPTLLRRRAMKAQKDGGEKAELPKIERPKLDLKTILFVYFMRPFIMLAQEPILILMTIYMSFIYGVVYLNFSAWPISFQEQRGWNAGVGALPFLSITVGVFAGCAITIYLTKTRFARKMQENNGVVVPEERLVPMMFGACLIPISLFWWAWTSNPHISWVPQVLAGAPFGWYVSFKLLWYEFVTDRDFQRYPDALFTGSQLPYRRV